ncbi:MAG: ATP-binding cassette domain-containing protein [Bacilli bacterium]|nr:ATP-binding cassette domain-containing protein [Bacilli bacterium]
MKIVMQDGIKDCGICSLLSIIRFYGGDVSKEYLRELTNTTKSGVSAYKLLEGAKKIGFTGFGCKGDIKNIDKNNLPCIAHLIINKSYQHFVTIYDIDLINKKVLIMDPAKGKKILSFSYFRLLSSNNYIFLKPIKKLPVVTKRKIILEDIKKFCHHNLLPIVIITILSLIYFLINIIVAFHFKYLLQFVINYELSINILFISYYLLIIYIVKELLLFLRNTLLLKMTSLFDYKVTTNTYKKILLLPYFYYKNRTTGEVISRIKDLNIVKTYLGNFICSITTDLFTAIIFIIFMFNINNQLTISVLLIIGIIFIYNYLITRLKRKRIQNYYNNEEKLNSYLIESLTSVETIKGLHIENNTLTKFRLKYKNYLESFYKMSILNEINTFFKNIINNFLLVIVYGFGTISVINNKISVAELFIYQGMLSYFLTSINNLIFLKQEHTSYKAALDRIHDMYTIKQEVFDGNKYNNFSLVGDIKYNYLTYGYNRVNLFNNLKLTIRSKEKILICGSSGSGKSTLIKMLMRYVEVPFDMIKINNVDINHYHLDNLRNKITYVSNSEFLFSDTIYNNIILNRKVSMEEVKNISKIVLLDEVISKNNLGYQNIVEENGFNFSGGERQRIVLARTLLKNSDIYIFDEALSQIDIDKERKILINIFKYLKNKTVIVISHRFNNCDLFNRVIKLEGGKIVENKKL